MATLDFRMAGVYTGGGVETHAELQGFAAARRNASAHHRRR